jgi:hypothetical protein
MGTDQPVCVPIAADPLTLCVGSDVFLSASEAERFFCSRARRSRGQARSHAAGPRAPERVLLVLPPCARGAARQRGAGGQ